MSNVCHDCIGNRHLKTFINSKRTRGYCDYCGGNKHVIELEEFVEEIEGCILQEYESAVFISESLEDEVVSGVAFDNYDLINDYFSDELDISSDLLRSDLVNALNKTSIKSWIKRDFFRGTQDQFDKSLWSKFSNLIKYQCRYLSDRIEDGDEEDAKSSSSILDQIGKYVSEDNLKLLETFKRNSLTIFRGRVHSCDVELINDIDFYPPPREVAPFGRMNPDGIPMFYGALEIETVQSELYTEMNNCLSISKFTNYKKLLLLDLTKLEIGKLPSIFDRKKHNLRSTFLFLSYFAADVSKKIDNQYSIEYIPTQVVTEFFKHCYVKNGEKLDGIIYPSSKRKFGKNIVLFINRENMIDSKDKTLEIIGKRKLKYKKKYEEEL